MSHRKVTIQDLAKHLNVNPSTVSRGLNPDTRHLISPRTATRIRKAAEEFGYYPNRSAYALKKNRSLTIGILIPNIQNSVFPPMIRGMEQIFLPRRYTAIIANTEDDPELERSAVEHLKSLNVDGFIIATATRSDKLVAELNEEKYPVVLLNRTVDNADVNQVLSDEADGIRQALEHLVALGHSRIAHVAGPQIVSTGFRRRQAFNSYARELGLVLSDDLQAITSAFSEAEGYSGCVQLLDKGADFTALVAGNDLIALGCLDALRDHGLACPNDVSIIGYNNMPMLERMSPALTTVAIEHGEMGCDAARTILELLNQPASRSRTILLKPKLIIRGSTRLISSKDPKSFTPNESRRDTVGG